MFPATSPRKTPKIPGLDVVVNPKTSVTCTNVPEALFDATTAKKHFSKFGRMVRIQLYPKRQICIVEYDQQKSAERAVLNAGAFDGFMFDVTRTKPRLRKRSKKEDDPDWVPDSDVEEELSAMSGAPSPNIVTRSATMDTTPPVDKPNITLKPAQVLPVRKKLVVTPKSTVQQRIPVRQNPPPKQQPVSGIESPVVMSTTQTTLSTFEAANELHQLRSKVSLTPDEQWRILDARDRILRGWGGAGSRVKVGGATIGTCQDMCPEKELLHRQAEHQVMTLETVVESDGQLERWRAVKQYSRSSADQEIPMCYELRPASALMNTCAYLLHEIADTTRLVTLADWFHFMWDRFRSIRKDITQQALCCAESIQLVEMCARFHAHCAARLADLEHTQFDQKLNTDNLTKCLQTLKHMYADVTPEKRPREAEFRGYIALLNLGDANFWWEIKQLPLQIQKSAPIVFAIKIFNALDNNNYVKFFRLVQQEATYLQACILLRYFNDVRARALARIVKAYAPRGGSRFPAADMMSALAFESLDKMKAFISHYGLRLGRLEEHEPSIILSRHQFIEDSDPFPTARAINLIESKRQCSVGEVIAGGPLPNPDYKQHILHTSFNKDGKLKESALIAEEQGFNTINDSNKDIKGLKAEIQRLAQGGRNYTEATAEVKPVKSDIKGFSPKPKLSVFTTPPSITADKKMFSFKPAILVESPEIIKNSPEKLLDADAKNIFSFSKPQETAGANLFTVKDSVATPKGLFESMPTTPKSLFQHKDVKNMLNAKVAPDSKGLFQNSTVGSKSLFQNQQETKGLFANKAAGSGSLFENNNQSVDPKSLFGRMTNEKKNSFQNAENVFKNSKPEDSVFSKPDAAKSVFGQNTNVRQPDLAQNLFGKNIDSDSAATDVTPKSIFNSGKENSLFTKSNNTAQMEKGSIFTKPAQVSENTKLAPNIFATFNKESEPKFVFAKPDENQKNAQSIFASNGETVKVSPGNFFKSVLNPPNGSDANSYSIFQSKNKAQTVADNILNSVNNANVIDVYQFDHEEEQNQLHALNEEKLQLERELQQKQEEEKKQQELRRQKELQRLEELQRQEEARRKQEELRLLEEQRKKEEKRKQEELKKKLEEERKAELKRLAAENERKFKEAVAKESSELIEELVNEINKETSREILREEDENMRMLMKFANETCEEIVTEMNNEICDLEMKAEAFLTHKIMRKWFHIWRQQLFRNMKRRRLLDETPVWLPERTPIEEASCLRRKVEDLALKNMNDFHKGYKFSGELKQLPPPQSYNIVELIRSPLLKRMKEISYPYDKCFFWKVTLVAPGEDSWLCRKINIRKWLIDAFSDKRRHDESDTLIRVERESWNHLMDFAISVSLVNTENMVKCSEAVEGTNGIIFYFTERDTNIVNIIQQTLKSKYPNQVVPVAVIITKSENACTFMIQNVLAGYLEQKLISGFKIFLLEPQNINELLNASTKKALRWLSKKYPQIPPLEIDYLKSICQRYLGNEIWCRLKTECDGRMCEILKDIQKLIRCYNSAVDRLMTVITNEELFNYTSFPLEFKQYLDQMSPYPKPYEFIPSNVRTSENVAMIKQILNQLKLPNPSTNFKPISAVSMQQQIQTYCNQIGWFEDPEEVASKVVAVIPNELSDAGMSCDDFNRYFADYNLVDLLNIIVYEKINKLNKFDNRLAVYEQSVLHEYRNLHWLYEVDVFSQIKHEEIEFEDEIDYFIAAKRRKIALDSLDYLMLEDKDVTLVEENIKEADASIIKLNNCSEAVKQLEKEIEMGKKKSVEFENMLRAALANGKY